MKMNPETESFQSNPITNNNMEKNKEYKYTDESFWKKVGESARKAGVKVVEMSIVLWEALKDKDTPLWAESTILGALGYFICPIDAIPDVIPVAVYTDDLAVLVAAMGAVAMHVKKSHRKKAKKRLESWFGGEKDSSGVEEGSSEGEEGSSGVFVPNG